MKATISFLSMVAAVFVAGCASSPAPTNVDQLSGLSSTASLSASQCMSMGCSTAEAPSCPAVAEGFQSRQLACQCTTGNSCITQSSQ